MPVDAELVQGIAADQAIGDLADDGCHRLADALQGIPADERFCDVAIDRRHGCARLAAEPCLVAVAQLDRLAGAGGAPDGTAARPRAPLVKDHLDLDGRIATAVVDLAAADTLDWVMSGLPAAVRS